MNEIIEEYGETIVMFIFGGIMVSVFSWLLGMIV
jgi:hypothetical protein